MRLVGRVARQLCRALAIVVVGIAVRPLPVGANPCAPLFESAWGSFQYPLGVAIGPDGTVWIADHQGGSVRQYTPTGALLRTLPPVHPGWEPADVSVRADGTIFVADSYLNQVHVYSPAEYLASLLGGGNAPTAFVDVWGVALGPDGTLYVADRGRNRIAQFSPALSYVRAFGLSVPDFDEPIGIAVCPSNGDVWVAAHGTPTLHRFDRNGNHLVTVAAQAFDLAVDAEGNVSVPDWELEDLGITRIRVLAPDGTERCRWGKGGTDPGEFQNILGLAWTPGALYVADRIAGTILRFGEAVVPASVTSWGRLKQIYR